MPLPTGTTPAKRGSGLTRSEAAILAWKKRPRAAKPGALDPKIAARVKQILAAKQKKGPKGKAAPKAKAAPKGTPQEIANNNRAAIAKAGGMDKLEGTIVRLGVGMNSDLEKSAHDELISKGLATIGADGKSKLSPAGKKWKAAADKGNVEGANAALAEGRMAASEGAAKEKAKAEKLAAKETAKQEKEKPAAAAPAKPAAPKAAAKPAQKPPDAHEAAKPGKDKADPAKATAANRAKVAKEMAAQDAPLGPSGTAALNDFADGKPLDEKMASAFADMGLTEQGSDGAHRLTPEGRAAAQAMAKGDTRAALDAISKAKDKKKQAGDKAKAKADSTAARDKAKADRDKAAADKATAQASARDRLEQARIQSAQSRNRKAMSDEFIDPSSLKAGARHSKMDASHLDEAARHLHSAGAKCPDCAPMDEEADDSEATDAIKSIMDNPAWYAQHECGDVMQACSALQTLGMLIQSELGEENEDPADVSQLCDAADILVEFIKSELDELRGAAKEGTTIGHQPMKGIEVYGDDFAALPGYAVKAAGDGWTSGYLIKFGGDGDLSQWRDMFEQDTDYGRATKSDVWVHHRMLPGVGKQRLTNQADIGVDEEGVFIKHLLDLRSGYEAKLYGLVQAGKLGWSSGTAPHLVERKAMGDGRHKIEQWPLGLDASYTPTPAGGLVVNAGAMKSLLEDSGIDLLNIVHEASITQVTSIDTNDPEAIKSESARPDGVKADDVRTRRLLLELDILALETAQ